MTLPVFGNPIALNQIQTEFGGSNPINISEYYSGGAYVTAGTVGYPTGAGAVAIPSSGTISLANFYGASASFLLLPGYDTYDYETNGLTSAITELNYVYTGSWSVVNSPGAGAINAGPTGGNWISTTGAIAEYEYRIVSVSITQNTGGTGNFTPSSGPTSWQTIGSPSVTICQVSQPSPSGPSKTAEATFTIEVRKVSNPAIVQSSSIILIATAAGP